MVTVVPVQEISEEEKLKKDLDYVIAQPMSEELINDLRNRYPSYGFTFYPEGRRLDVYKKAEEHSELSTTN